LESLNLLLGRHLSSPVGVWLSFFAKVLVREGSTVSQYTLFLS
jgi:hypothetical protein